MHTYIQTNKQNIHTNKYTYKHTQKPKTLDKNGDFFGGVSLLGGTNFEYTAKANTDSLLLQLERKKFINFKKFVPQTNMNKMISDMESLSHLFGAAKLDDENKL